MFISSNKILYYYLFFNINYMYYNDWYLFVHINMLFWFIQYNQSNNEMVRIKGVEMKSQIVLDGICIGNGQDNDMTSSEDYYSSLYIMLKEAAKLGLEGPFTFKIINKHIKKFDERYKFLTGRYVVTSKNQKIIRSSLVILASYYNCSKCGKSIKVNILDCNENSYGYTYDKKSRHKILCKKCLWK